VLAIVNKSTRVSNNDVATMTRACATQLRLHAAPLWGLLPIPVIYYPDTAHIPPSAVVLGVFDDSDQEGALGWHTEDPDGTQYGRVFAGPVLDNGGNALTNTLSVASVLSHEVLEWFVDPRCNGWWDNGSGVLYAAEVCDPVESDSYVINVTHGTAAATPVTVSNFVTPAWGDPQAHQGAMLDYMQRCSKPFRMSKGGYVITRTAAGEKSTFGEKYPEWRAALKTSITGRSTRRVAGE
jgi:hypothetical protein